MGGCELAARLLHRWRRNLRWRPFPAKGLDLLDANDRRPQRLGDPAIQPVGYVGDELVEGSGGISRRDDHRPVEKAYRPGDGDQGGGNNRDCKRW